MVFDFFPLFSWWLLASCIWLLLSFWKGDFPPWFPRLFGVYGSIRWLSSRIFCSKGVASRGYGFTSWSAVSSPAGSSLDLELLLWMNAARAPGEVGIANCFSRYAGETEPMCVGSDCLKEARADGLLSVCCLWSDSYMKNISFDVEFVFWMFLALSWLFCCWSWVIGYAFFDCILSFSECCDFLVSIGMPAFLWLFERMLGVSCSCDEVPLLCLES